MTEVLYKIGTPSEFNEGELDTFLALLKEQGKVTKPTLKKIERCELLGICLTNTEMVSIGAVKPKTNSDFNLDKSALQDLRDEFILELGYFYTKSSFGGKGISSAIFRILIEKLPNENLMASTELRNDNAMVRILEKNGFKLFGKPWKSQIHGKLLGLYLKFI